jgi:hypothetical protein
MPDLLARFHRLITAGLPQLIIALARTGLVE